MKSSPVFGTESYRVDQYAELARDRYAEVGITVPPAAPFDPELRLRPLNGWCVHCAVDPIRTQKDGLCRNCKTYKTSHQGQLPPQKVIDARRRKREGQ